VDDFFNLKLNYPRMKAIVTAGVLVKDLGPRFIIHGSKGSFIKYGIDPQEEPLRNGVLPKGDDWGFETPDKWGLVTVDFEDLNFDGRIETEAGNYMGFYSNVYDVLINNAEMYIKPVEARNVIRVIELAFESVSLGKEIEVLLD
jgi:predicted dehydrogenase